jgi:hypothetical protein
MPDNTVEDTACAVSALWMPEARQMTGQALHGSGGNYPPQC